jgi:hypothetical protein
MDAKRWALAQIALYTALRETFADNASMQMRIDKLLAELRLAAS